ncbi:hypothetical protein BACCIP111895_01341 [Neobacillus rhizosphaerae]|uniref:Restriction endonuclease type IV Mrr domain-containing protein n=1 Tax=Neobacillus rhizosphaerae TaxID=2880965 RepID=A0ABM9ENN0_9BACI|nr:hypothetical protein [Neobacillus rhizosphaerae]CAH2714187.1 hypothetical protein BACCIP111895_01341 [Neobacillus rhizosphaerae]
MIKTRFSQYNGDSWEEACQLFLKKRYESEGYQEMIAHTQGDLGIEGFTRTGIVFQCYCPDEEYESKKLYELQRDKVTTDLGKLSKNKKELIRYIGSVKIKKWIFLTPIVRNKELISHCQEKAIEYKNNLEMKELLDDEFDVLVQDEGFFVEEMLYVKAILEEKIDVNVATPSLEEIINWKECEAESVQILFRKISKLFNGNSNAEANTNKYVDIIIRNLIKGQNVLDELRDNHPILLEKLVRVKSGIETHIEQELLLTNLQPKEFNRVIQTKYKSALESEAFGRMISFVLQEDVIKEAEADWLVRCPLDFEEGA